MPYMGLRHLLSNLALVGARWFAQPDSAATGRFQRGSPSLHERRGAARAAATEATSRAIVTYRRPRICETTPGVQSYAGYVHTDGTSHAFFWYFEARKSPQTAPITLWLNGGPGTDSLMGLFGGEVPFGMWRRWSSLTGSRDRPLLCQSRFDYNHQPLFVVRRV